MILASSDIASSLRHWEWAEYISEGFVILGCAGELFADLGKRCVDRPLLQHIERWSTIVLVIALTVGLKCLVKTNEISGYVIGSLGDEADEADAKAKTAISDSTTALAQAKDALTKAGTAQESLGKAETEAKNAQTLAANAFTLSSGARKEADSFERDIVLAKEAAAKAEAKLADRTLSDAQVVSIGDELKRFKGQPYTITAYWDSKESLGLANRIHPALHDVAKWAYSDEGTKSMMLGGIVGVQVWTHPDADKSTKEAATALINALNAEGIETEPRQQNPKNPKTNMININIGSKR